MAVNHQREDISLSQQTQSNHSDQHFQGTKFKEKSVIFGVIGFFVLGIVFGPLAIINANKAEKLNHSATFGKVLGWIDTIFGALGIIVMIIFIGGSAFS